MRSCTARLDEAIAAYNTHLGTQRTHRGESARKLDRLAQVVHDERERAMRDGHAVADMRHLIDY